MMELTASWEGGYRCRVPIRDFEVVVDEPVEDGGTIRNGPEIEYRVAAAPASHEG